MTIHRKAIRAAILFAILLMIFPVFGQGRREVPIEPSENEAAFRIRGVLPEWTTLYSADEVETAVLAGGCFWGVEAVFEQLDGVLNVDSGYSGGEAETASYKLVGTGDTGHAEAVEIIYDPSKISYKALLEVFFEVAHDPTQLNYQGPDHGTEYRSVIFFTDDEQRQISLEVMESLDEADVYKDEIVTELVPLDKFYPAEEYHQDFLRLNPSHPYIAYWDIPKLVDLQFQFPELIASDLDE